MVATMRTIPGLTGLRGVDALWVLLYHLTLSRDIPVLEHGDLGVDVFFILSGYVLCLVYADRLALTDLRAYLQFLRARVARIYPLHFLSLALLAVIVLAAPGFTDRYPLISERFGVGPFVASLLLIQNWGHWLPTCWNTPAWSLSAEWFAYLGFPLFLALSQRWRLPGQAIVLAVACLVILVATLLAKGLTAPTVIGTPGMLRMACEFMCGCLIYRAIRLGLPRLPGWVDAGASILLIVALSAPSATMLALPAFALLITLAAQNAGPVAWLTSSKPIVWLGEISYSIYLLHWIVLQISNWYLDGSALSPLRQVAWDCSLIIAIFALSVLSYKYVERPVRTWGRKLGQYNTAVPLQLDRSKPSSVVVPPL